MLEALKRFRGQVSLQCLLPYRPAEIQKSGDSVPGFFEESSVVADVLGGSVDFMGDAGRQLANGFQFLRLAQLTFQTLIASDVIPGYDEAGVLVGGCRNTAHQQIEKAALPVALPAYIVALERFLRSQPARQLGVHVGVEPANTTVVESAPQDALVFPSEPLGSREVPPGDTAFAIQADDN